MHFDQYNRIVGYRMGSHRNEGQTRTRDRSTADDEIEAYSTLAATVVESLIPESDLY
jgi:hypothetical protein